MFGGIFNDVIGQRVGESSETSESVIRRAAIGISLFLIPVH